MSPLDADPAQLLSHAALLRLWPGFDAIASDLDVPYYTVAAWFRRSSVPERYWDALARSAKRRGLRGATYASFRSVAAKRRAVPPLAEKSPSISSVRQRSIKGDPVAAQDAQRVVPHKTDLPRKTSNVRT